MSAVQAAVAAACAFVRANPARVYAVVVALLALLAAYGLELPTEAWLALVAALLGLGEAVQRVEDRKSLEAAAGGGADREGP